MDSQKRHATLFDLLSVLKSGRITITVDGQPLLLVRSEERELDLENSGVMKTGLTLTRIIKLGEGDTNILRGAESMAEELSRLGWRATLYDDEEKILVMGRDVSRLTAHISTNPLKLRRLLKALG
jgi:hypothetical protein